MVVILTVIELKSKSLQTEYSSFDVRNLNKSFTYLNLLISYDVHQSKKYTAIFVIKKPFLIVK